MLYTFDKQIKQKGSETVRTILKDCKRIVVKVGTATITHANGKLNLKRMDELAWVLTDLRNRGIDVVLVTSGAIGVGSSKNVYGKTSHHHQRKTSRLSCRASNVDADLSQFF